MPIRPNGLAARLRQCPNKTFWRSKLGQRGERTPDYNSVFLWYMCTHMISTSLDTLVSSLCPKIPSFQRAVSIEAQRRRDGGRVEK